METMGTRVQESKSNKTESAKNGYKMIQKSFRIYLGLGKHKLEKISKSFEISESSAQSANNLSK